MLNSSFEFLHSFIREGGSHISFHSHHNFELVYYVSGVGKTQIGKTNHDYGPGQFSVIPPNLKHDEYRYADTKVVFICFFHDNQAIPLREGLWEDTADGLVLSLLNGIMNELTGKKLLFEQKINAILHQLIVEIARLSGSAQRNQTDPKIDYAKKLFDQYGSDRFDLPGLAKQLGYSYDHFRHIFKDATGYSPMQYIVRSRMEQAKRLLSGTDQPITSVAGNCGFSNPSQFNMMFKKETGLTPSSYRLSKFHVF